MSETAGQYKLERFERVKPLNEQDNLWLVRDSVTQEALVLRQLSPGTGQVYRRLETLRHPGVVSVREVFSCGEADYAVEEQMPGRPLSEVLEEGPLGKQAIPVGVQLLEALEALRGLEIVHRDIKPANIMWDGAGRAVLIDFGIARLYREQGRADTAAKGTRTYAPPEQFGFAQSDFRSDIYALGVTLNELFTGRLPEEVLCPGQLGRVVRRCTESDPRRRYQTAKAALAALKKLGGRGKRIFLAVLSLLLCVSALYPFWLPGEGSEPPLAERAAQILFVRNEEMPSFLLTEDGTWKLPFAPDGEKGRALTVQKEGERLTLSDGGENTLSFEDLFQEQYEKDYGALSPEEHLPQYEIVPAALDENGQQGLLVLLARRRWVNTPNPDSRYYLTEYSALWAVYSQGQSLVCTEPLFFGGDVPTWEGNGVVSDRLTNEWFVFREGEWRAAQ